MNGLLIRHSGQVVMIMDEVTRERLEKMRENHKEKETDPR